MSNMMQTGASWLGEKLKSAAGREVVYSQGGTPATLTGWPGEMRQEVVGTDLLGTGIFVQAWQFIAADLAVEPRPGDRITESALALQWEAMPPAPNRKCFEWADSSGILLTIWFKRVKT